MGEKLKVLLVDVQILFVESLRCVLEDRTDDLEIVGIAHDGNEAVLAAMKHRPDVILMDVRMPGMDGVLATREIHRLYPQIRILMLTTFQDDEYVKVALQHGALGYLLKNIQPAELIRSIRTVRQTVAQISPEIMSRLVGGARPSAQAFLEGLTPREKDVLQLCLRALDNQTIAQSLGLSEQTVKNHIHNLYSKLGVSSRLELLHLLGAQPGPA